MVRPHRLSTTVAVVALLFSTLANSPLFASENESSSSSTQTTVVASPDNGGAIQAPASIFSSTMSLPLEAAADNGHRLFDLGPTKANAFAQIYQGRPYRAGPRSDGSIAAIMIGAVAAIAGAAVLVYANRPECDMNRFAGGCGYGTKVIGGAVLSGGMVGIVVGALTWR